MKGELSIVEQSQELEPQEKSMGIAFQEFLESKGVDVAEFDK